jgi:hypothetical protein
MARKTKTIQFRLTAAELAMVKRAEAKDRKELHRSIRRKRFVITVGPLSASEWARLATLEAARRRLAEEA